MRLKINAAKAKKNLYSANNDMPSPFQVDLKILERVFRSTGYLEALQGEEVKELVKAIEKVIKECFLESEAGAVESLEDALSKYHEAIKGEPK